MNWFTITKVSDRLYAFAEFAHWEKSICYLFVGDTRAILFDTGMGYGSIRQAVFQITTLPVTVLLTHGHWDHIGGATAFDDVRIFDDPFDLGLLAKGFSSSTITELADGTCYTDDFVPKSYVVPGRLPSVTLVDGQIITVDAWQFRVLHTPGHTPGSVSFLCQSEQLVIVGDLLYAGPLYAHLAGANIHVYKDSVLRLIEAIDEQTAVFCGHNAYALEYRRLQAVYKGFSSLCSGQKSLQSKDTVEYVIDDEIKIIAACPNGLEVKYE